jgi:hypothetical protein
MATRGMQNECGASDSGAGADGCVARVAVGPTPRHWPGTGGQPLHEVVCEAWHQVTLHPTHQTGAEWLYRTV